MRIISGRSRGRSLLTPKTSRTKDPLIRPTSDKAREALFNIIGPRIVGARVLDLFAGTGALGLEALSRGADQAVFVDDSRYACALVAENCRLCQEEGASLILRRNLRKTPRFLTKLGAERPFDLIFMDPPYGKGFVGNLLYFLAKSEGVLAEHGCIIVEEAADSNLPDRCQDLLLKERRLYGKTAFGFYQRSREQDE
ncbi:MAG: 16S rRNA (guanine(966)-N(2))-methyltransferase RsmD [Desulfobulbaceae bacterium]|nr:MAG: 16S rRNA (guanine(966)-N(2))-methyltransferase RsmD [Desulfobulbaceae bacterium]